MLRKWSVNRSASRVLLNVHRKYKERAEYRTLLLALNAAGKIG